MYYPGLVHETNTIKNTGVAPTDRTPRAHARTRTLALHTTSPAHTLSHCLAPFTALLSLSLSLSLSSVVRACACATDPAHTGRARADGASRTLTRGCRCNSLGELVRLTARGHSSPLAVTVRMIWAELFLISSG